MLYENSKHFITWGEIVQCDMIQFAIHVRASYDVKPVKTVSVNQFVLHYC